METTLQSFTVKNTQNTVAVKSKAKSDFWAQVEFNRFGISPAILTIVVCISGFAAAFAITNGVIQLAFVGFPTAVFISCIIAISPMRVIFSLAFVTLIIDFLIIALHMI